MDFERRCDPNRWATFKDICWREFSFDPDEDGIQGRRRCAASRRRKMGRRLAALLRCTAPLSGRVGCVAPGPPARPARPRRPFPPAGTNEEQEDKLRKELEATLSLPHAQACDKVEKLDNEHKERRGWVWAQLGESPYAVALEPLGRLAKAAKTTLGGPTAEAIAADYASHGWRCDRAAMEALCRLKQGARKWPGHEGRAGALRTMARSLSAAISGADVRPWHGSAQADHSRCRGTRHMRVVCRRAPL